MSITLRILKYMGPGKEEKLINLTVLRYRACEKVKGFINLTIKILESRRIKVNSKYNNEIKSIVSNQMSIGN